MDLTIEAETYGSSWPELRRDARSTALSLGLNPDACAYFFNVKAPATGGRMIGTVDIHYAEPLE
jgi:hypothetical protein